MGSIWLFFFLVILFVIYVSYFALLSPIQSQRFEVIEGLLGSDKMPHKVNIIKGLLLHRCASFLVLLLQKGSSQVNDN